MSVSVTKNGFNVREKLKQLQKPIGLKGSELMRAETAQEARDFVSAGRKNLVINGAMEISQRGTSFPSLSSGSNYTLDRFRLFFSSGNGGTWTVTQESDAPPGFKKSLKALCTSGYTNVTNNYVSIASAIEGYDLNHLSFGTSNAKPITISFWVKCSKSGPRLMFEIYKNRHFSRLININQANTWEYKTETVDGDTAQAFLNSTNGAGAYINFFIGLGTDNKTSAINKNWSNFSSGARGTGLINLNETNDYIQITGVQLEVGKNATEFEHRSYGEELALCQRYFQVYPPRSGGALFWVVSYLGGTVRATVLVPKSMRALPTPTDPNTGTTTCNTGNVFSTNGTNVNSQTNEGSSPVLSVAGTLEAPVLIMSWTGASAPTTFGNDYASSSWNGGSPGIFLDSEL